MIPSSLHCQDLFKALLNHLSICLLFSKLSSTVQPVFALTDLIEGLPFFNLLRSCSILPRYTLIVCYPYPHPTFVPLLLASPHSFR